MMSEVAESTTEAAPIRVGLIGYGLAGRVFHAPFLRTNRDFSLRFVATSDESRVAEARSDFPGVRIAGSGEELLRHAAELDLVVITSPPHLHFAQALSALRAGLAVVVDKPFVPTVREGEQLIAEAERRGLPLMVFHSRRWDGDFMTVRTLVESGRLGEIVQFESAFEDWEPQADAGWRDSLEGERGGGVAFDIGSHLVDQALQLFGPVRRAAGDIRSVRDGAGNDDHSTIDLEHESGTRSRLLMTKIGAIAAPRFRVLGTKGTFVSVPVDGQQAALTAGVSPDAASFGVTETIDYGTLSPSPSGDRAGERVPTADGKLTAFYEAVGRTVQSGEPFPIDPRSALETVRIIETLHRSK